MQAVLATDEPMQALSEWAKEYDQKLTSIEEQMDSIQQDVVNLSTLSVLLSEMGKWLRRTKCSRSFNQT